MSYIFTNHFLNPLSKTTDALANTTSVIVHPIFDWLHLNFSYHTEHHIFPAMNSDFYPVLSNLLKDLYGDSYHRMHFADAWNCLWKIEIYASDDNLSMRVDPAFVDVQKVPDFCAMRRPSCLVAIGLALLTN
jgi:fatty acid desaturase